MTELLDYLEDENMYDFEKSMNEKADKILQMPYNHLMIKSGKEIRQRFMKTLCCWFDYENCQLDQISDYLKLIHNATLLIDDIQDRTILRRGDPASYIIYGIPLVIQCASGIFLQLIANWRTNNDNSQGNVKSTSDKVITEKVSYHIMQLLRGQIMEIYWRDNFFCPTLEQYLDMIGKKTGVLFDLTVDEMSSYFEKNTHINGLSDLLGQYFQIRDDYLNLKNAQFHKTKGFCEDLTEGKFSFPIVYAINAYPEDGRILEILKKRPKDVETKLECLKILEELGSFEVTIKYLDKIKKEMQDKIKYLGGNVEFLEFLDSLEYY